MLTDHDNYYLNQKKTYKSCLLTLKEVILDLDKNITPQWKHTLPFFYYKKRPFSYFWKDKNTQEPCIGICRGNEIKHPLLEAGNRTQIKIFRIKPTEDLDIENIL